MSIKGKPIKLLITTTGGAESILDSCRFQIPLIDSDGRIRTLVYGINKITNDISSIEVNRVVNLFENLSPSNIFRPGERFTIKSRKMLECLNTFLNS